MELHKQKSIDSVWQKYRIALKRLDRALDLIVITPPLPKTQVVDDELAIVGLDDEIKVATPKQASQPVVSEDDISGLDDEYVGMSEEQIVHTENQKRVWKALNPGAKLKSLKYQKKVGFIEELPWKDLILPTADGVHIKENNSDFGTHFPKTPAKGDTFLRVDQTPHTLYKWNDKKWIEVDKENNISYTMNEEYIDHLVFLISKGEYDPERLSENEREALEEHLHKREQDK